MAFAFRSLARSWVEEGLEDRAGDGGWCRTKRAGGLQGAEDRNRPVPDMGGSWAVEVGNVRGDERPEGDGGPAC